uniref:Uncharacterized protein n=1 Tax=Chlamydomonas euryale TaxID=1486919 RepID=A0A7R9YSW5_9CHLO|mmetsp:Transcript_2176/g.5741  ORF Transcript_2176/g.5741 Transcript_2176/m.5741 type:complete len:203 (+) Transcript_2176:1305-1913(+)
MCALGDNLGGYSLCIMMWVVGAVSLAASLTMFALAACISTRSCVTSEPWLEFMAAVAGTIVWIGSAIALTVVLLPADANGVPQKQWRRSVVGLSWTGVFLFLFTLLISFIPVARICCVDCIACCAKAKTKEGRHGDEEEPAVHKEEEEAVELGRHGIAEEPAGVQIPAGEKSSEQQPTAADKGSEGETSGAAKLFPTKPDRA